MITDESHSFKVETKILAGTPQEYGVDAPDDFRHVGIATWTTPIDGKDEHFVDTTGPQQTATRALMLIHTSLHDRLTGMEVVR